jgi:hypothetical protein
MAIGILSIPPESSDVESYFSSARCTLSWDRESMTCESLAKVECMGNWMREGIIVPRSHGDRGIISSVVVEFSVETEAEDFLDQGAFLFFPLACKNYMWFIWIATLLKWLCGYMDIYLDISISR